ncbi:MAG: DUF1592 domain-containing protein [Myxococcales bacterium]|nr:DUF1592 domain-containing protein [Myxococcota bacterium]MDW8281813.1 DUF1592 domain-containing protein [Myxococcales bacterium]
MMITRRILVWGLLLGACSHDSARTATEPVPGDQMAMSCPPLPTRIWKLTPEQYSHTVATLIPGAGRAGDRLRASLFWPEGPFRNRAAVLAMSQPHVDQLFETAVWLSEMALREPARLHPCLASLQDHPGCVRAFIGSFASRAFRRPLHKEEEARYLAFWDEQSALYDTRTALALFVRAVLLSPHFLYRFELGPEEAPPGLVELTAHERASALSYLLTDGPPDAELMAAADRNELGTQEQMVAQARRLLARPGLARGVDKFFEELLQLGDVPTLTKTRAYFPTFTSQVAADLAEETRRFIRYVLWEDGGHLHTLLTANYSLLNGRLSQFYQVPGATGEEYVRVELPNSRHAGLLTHGSLLASLASEKETRPVARGKFIRERLLCQAIPPPPPDVNAVPPADNRMRTQRERLARHAADASCRGCHVLMDPLGLALENFDAAGLFRTQEYGKPIDASGMLVGVGAPQHFVGAPGLAAVLAAAPETTACFARMAFAYAYGLPTESCAAEAVVRQFAASGGNVMDLLIHLATAPELYRRWRPAEE